MTDPTPVDVDAEKRALRREMRLRRLEVAELERSLRICEALVDLVDPGTARLVMVYEAVQGEPDLTPFVNWCAAVGIETVAPERAPNAGDPVDASAVDVVVVPGLAFTVEGDRLGQGGGWYDRFLVGCRTNCRVVGVAFQAQVLASLPIEPHDVRVDMLVTEFGIAT